MVRSLSLWKNLAPSAGVFIAIKKLTLQPNVQKKILLMENKDLEAVNRNFNEQLQQQIAGTLPKQHTYTFGNASEVLQSADIPNLPIELQAYRLSDKSMQENHPFDLSELLDLPKAIHNPLAVFRSATHVGSFVIMTEIEHYDRNFVVALMANKSKGNIEINDIRSIHYRQSNSHIANWINENLLNYADKRRMVEWFSKQRYNSAEVRKPFNHAAKVIENFVNPKILTTNLQEFPKKCVRSATLQKVNKACEQNRTQEQLPKGKNNNLKI
ncbi:hypothetical protein FACS1894199_02860 [Bacteroidia bacterium]|nr:hypothetical protein FACS1894199_02860 [Bacteroidia bacterium]